MFISCRSLKLLHNTQIYAIPYNYQLHFLKQLVYRSYSIHSYNFCPEFLFAEKCLIEVVQPLLAIPC